MLAPPWSAASGESEDAMKGRHGLSRTIVLTICVIVPLSLAEVGDYEPSGFHLDVEVDENQFPESVPVLARPLPDDRLCITTDEMLPSSSPRCSGPVDAGSFSLPPNEAGPGSSTVLRI